MPEPFTPIALSIPDAAAAIGCGVSKIHELVAANEIVAVKIGARTVIRVDSLRALIDRAAPAPIKVPSLTKRRRNAEASAA